MGQSVLLYGARDSLSRNYREITLVLWDGLLGGMKEFGAERNLGSVLVFCTNSVDAGSADTSELQADGDGYAAGSRRG